MERSRRGTLARHRCLSHCLAYARNYEQVRYVGHVRLLTHFFTAGLAGWTRAWNGPWPMRESGFLAAMLVNTVGVLSVIVKREVDQRT